jgi:hypothetical protein
MELAGRDVDDRRVNDAQWLSVAGPSRNDTRKQQEESRHAHNARRPVSSHPHRFAEASRFSSSKKFSMTTRGALLDRPESVV